MYSQQKGDGHYLCIELPFAHSKLPSNVVLNTGSQGSSNASFCRVSTTELDAGRSSFMPAAATAVGHERHCSCRYAHINPSLRLTETLKNNEKS
jgi:hypothetical protein